MKRLLFCSISAKLLLSMAKKSIYVTLFKQLGEFDNITGITRIVCVDEFVDSYASLRFGNGGGWCRIDGSFGKKYKICVAKRDGEIRFSWNPVEEERARISKEITSFEGAKFTNGKSIYLIKMCGFLDRISGRPIRKDIRDALKSEPCVVCGTHSQIEIDHKNGLYNDTRVLSSKTQTIDDFQPLCKHCNDQKRETYNYTKNTGKRYPATMIPMLRPFGVDFVEGDETFDPNNSNATVGSYWHDPVHFMSVLSGKNIKN